MHFKQTLALGPFHDTMVQRTFKKFWQNSKDVDTHVANLIIRLVSSECLATGKRVNVSEIIKYFTADSRLPTTNSRLRLLAHKFIQVTPFFFCGSSDLAWSLACMKNGCLVLESLNFLGGCNVYVIFYGFLIFYTIVEQSRHLYSPSFVFCFYLVFVTNTY